MVQEEVVSAMNLTGQINNSKELAGAITNDAALLTTGKIP